MFRKISSTQLKPQRPVGSAEDASVADLAQTMDMPETVKMSDTFQLVGILLQPCLGLLPCSVLKVSRGQNVLVGRVGWTWDRI